MKKGYSNILIFISKKAHTPAEQTAISEGNLEILISVFTPQRHKDKYLRILKANNKSNFLYEEFPYHKSWTWITEPAQNALFELRKEPEDDDAIKIMEDLQHGLTHKEIDKTWSALRQAIRWSHK
jgi:predicted type IV restriction endonuclease